MLVSQIGIRLKSGENGKRGTELEIRMILGGFDVKVKHKDWNIDGSE